MNMTPNERARQEAKEIVETWFNAYRVITSDFEKRELKTAITSALVPKYELMETTLEFSVSKLNPTKAKE